MMAAHSQETEDGAMTGSEVAPVMPPDGRQPGGLEYRVAVFRHYKAVYGYAAAILGSGADAEDVTQETFLRFGLRGGEVKRPREWLLSVARNLCFDRFRSAARMPTLDPDAIQSVEAEEVPDRIVDRDQRSARLLAVVESLTEPQRSLIVLFDMQGMSGDECARILGLSTNQVKVYLHRARRRVRERMERENG